jgi:trk system potassium uptake protein TrkH
MRWDVLYLILGWTIRALVVPLVLIAGITAVMDDEWLAVRAFLPSAFLALLARQTMLRFGTTVETNDRLRDREAFATVALSWPVVVAFGAMPFWFGGMFVGPFNEGASMMEMADGLVYAIFESMSGFTTTGTTVIDPISSPACMPPNMVDDCIAAQSHGLLLWRSMTQWLGGMGIIMLSMMVLSRILGGGMSLARAELTGPSLSRLRPKLAQTARALWGIYLLLTVAEAGLLYGLTDMNLFDSINHALTTLPTGGFSTTDASIGGYDSVMVEAIIILFMFLAGVNFTLLFFVMTGKLGRAFADEEFRTYAVYLGVATLVITLSLMLADTPHAFRDALFQVVSIGTSTGYGTEDYIPWPVLTHVILLFLMVIGACAGSTGGGLKLLRVSLAFKVARRELRRITSPRRIHGIRMNGESVEREQIELIVGMLLVWILLFAGATFLLAILLPDHDLETLISVVASSLGNTGPALGSVGTGTWAHMPNTSLLLTATLMWFGRLELLTAVILFAPSTWREPGGRRRETESEEHQNNVV